MATTEEQASRSLVRSIAGGTGAVSQAVRGLIGGLRADGSSVKIADSKLLRTTAGNLEIAIDGRDDAEVAYDVAESLAGCLSESIPPESLLNGVPERRRAVWKKLGIEPGGIDYAVTQAMQASENDFRQETLGGLKCALSAGWNGSVVATAVTDILFGAPEPARVRVGDVDLVAGFSPVSIVHMLGGRFRGSLKPLNDAIIDGRIRGIAAVVGDMNPDVDEFLFVLARILIENDVLLLAAGSLLPCSAAEFLTPESALTLAGAGLREICEVTGMTPLLHMGDFIYSSRILAAAAGMILEGGLGEDFSDLPVASVLLQPLDDVGVVLGSALVASGFHVLSPRPLVAMEGEKMEQFLTVEMESMTGGKFSCEADPAAAAMKIMDGIEKKRDALGINAKKERKLYDMKERREL